MADYELRRKPGSYWLTQYSISAFFHDRAAHSTPVTTRKSLLKFSLAGFMVLLLVPAAIASPLFPNPIIDLPPSDSYGSGSMFLADFNRDGNVDLLLGSGVMLLGDGGGGLSRAPGLDTGRVFLVRDFNADGNPDMIASSSQGAAVRLGNGDGTFGDPTPLTSEGYCGAGAAADFDGDGRDDLLVCGSIFPGLGNGRFGAPVPLGFPTGATVGDWNGDGRMDFAVANYPRQSDISFFLGNGDFTFALGSTFPEAGGGVISINSFMASGDFNGDERDDIVATNPRDYEGYGACVFLSQGDGSFVRAPGGDTNSPYPPPSGCYTGAYSASGVVTADFNKDGRMDLVVAGNGMAGMAAGDVAILLGQPDGTFDPEVRLGTKLDASLVGVADLDHDGRQDIVVSTYRDRAVAVLVATGDGTSFQPAVASVMGNALAPGDFNSDGLLDLAAPSGVFLGLGDGDFAPEQSFSAELDEALIVADFNGDGTADLTGIRCRPDGSSGIELMLGLGDGRFGASGSVFPVTYMRPGGHFPRGCVNLVAGDFNGDGSPDLALPGFLLLNRGDATFEPAISLDTGPGASGVAKADFNGDGREDLAVASCNPDGFSVLLGNGDGTFDTAYSFDTEACVDDLQVADFNQDGRQDVLVKADWSVTVFLGEGDGSFTAVLPVSDLLANPVWLTTGDFDADGKIDIAGITLTGQSGQHSDITIIFGNGSGSFGRALRFSPGVWHPIIAADFNGDGRQDLAVIANSPPAYNTLSVLLNQGPFPNRPPSAIARADSPTECTSSAGGVVTLDGTGSTDPDSTPGTQDDIASYEWYESAALLGSGALLQIALPLGPHLITLKVTDRAGAVGMAKVPANVVDTRPPEIQLQLAPSLLWPPNHKLVEVGVSVAALDACGASAVSLLSVSHNESEDAPGRDGDTGGDIQGADIGTADSSFLLRAERNGKGTGRVYEVTYAAVDASGNVSTATATVIVPRDLSGVPANLRRAIQRKAGAKTADPIP